MVTIKEAEAGSKLQLMRLRSEATGCSDNVGATFVLEEQPIKDHNQRMMFPAENLQAGMYCALVLSTSGNYTTRWPQELRNEHDLSGVHADEAPLPCRSWKATVTLRVSYARSTIKASVDVLEKKTPLCEHLRVSLWEVMNTTLAQLPPCATHIKCRSEQRKILANLSVVALFENLSAGNYCVRVTPVCSAYEDCLTLTSKIVEMPLGTVSHTADKNTMGYLLWLPLVLGALVAAVLVTYWAQRQHRAPQGEPCQLELPLLANNSSKDAGVLGLRRSEREQY